LDHFLLRVQLPSWILLGIPSCAGCNLCIQPFNARHRVQPFYTPPVGSPFGTPFGISNTCRFHCESYHLCNPGISTICGTRSLCHCGTPCRIPSTYVCNLSYTMVYRIYRASLLELPWCKSHAPCTSVGFDTATRKSRTGPHYVQ
jgi:hypothetical protein